MCLFIPPWADWLGSSQERDLVINPKYIKKLSLFRYFKKKPPRGRFFIV